jgi:hypothetical protein
MTAQVREKLIYNGLTVGMATEPLKSFLQSTGTESLFVPPHTANWRGYIGEWLIENDQLFLLGLNGLIKGNKEINMNFFFPNTEKVFAEWFSGTIRVPHGEMIHYVHSGYESQYERDLYLDVKNGIIISSRLIENNDSHIETDEDYEVALKAMDDYFKRKERPKPQMPLSIIAAALLFIAILNLPIGYYTFMRIAVTALSLYLGYIEINRQQKTWLVFYFASAIVFNPLVPIYLKNRGAWMPIDIAFGILFIFSSLRKP